MARAFAPLERLAFGGAMQRCRVRFLDRVVGARRALTVGEGDGRFLLALLRAAPGAQVTVVDASARMLELARCRLEREAPDWLARVEFVQGDLSAVALQRGAFDLVATCFFLDCFEGDSLTEIVEGLDAAAAPEATWIVADFHRPPSGWRSLHARAWLALLYAFFGVTTGSSARRLEDPAPRLEARGWHRTATHDERAGLLHSEVWHRAAR
ncbi:class I SAM-dependent methyltransferase [Engelhardtia mirabilis]|uniref:Ubiquinone/menaquinone biosynthesis methyltransferase n=1 Tax=Engelhardtia mirabilis TaxID=2528011 RepID=A0A518BI14_9BACT|nr:ubiquinone/menaquinone biosynthesis methyltransferase [Planctomycetes bacterium Pla133]QDV00909.1 ubiquinone/menaquinone biosynthesis methyltransferase [Planctomycetes bacterium Pla86]